MTKGIEIVSFVNERNEMNTRNRKAQAYSKACAYKKMKAKNKRKEMVTEFVSAIFFIGINAFFWLQLFI